MHVKTVFLECSLGHRSGSFSTSKFDGSGVRIWRRASVSCSLFEDLELEPPHINTRPRFGTMLRNLVKNVDAPIYRLD
jgi:hypothetical protein